MLFGFANNTIAARRIRIGGERSDSIRGFLHVCGTRRLGGLRLQIDELQQLFKVRNVSTRLAVLLPLKESVNI